MSNERIPKSRAIAWVLCALVAAPTLYVLSLGPAFYLSYKFYSTKSIAPWLLAYEMPMGCLGDTPIQPIVNQYTEWWLELAGFEGTRF